MNVAYKHLNAKLKIGEFTTGQWATVLVGTVLMLGWGFYLSPLGTYLTIITAVYIGGLPVSLALLATYAELNVWRISRAAFTWARSDGAFSAGPSDRISGYVLTPDPRTQRHGQRQSRPTLDLAALWE
jgi:hypothetical protein